MMRKKLTLAAFCFAGIAGLCEEPKTGPKLVEVSRTCLRENSDAMNFCCAHRFGDGEVWLGHTIGRHTVSERDAAMISKDNGKTFCETDLQRGGSCVFTTRDGFKRRIQCFESRKIQEEHAIKVITYGNDGKSSTSVCKVKFPLSSGFRHWRDVVRLKSGRLLATGYGSIQQEKGKNMSFFLESDDDGLNWKYLSSLPYEDTAEGLNETAVVELKSGKLLAYARTGYSLRGDKSHPLLQFASEDGGRTWGGRREIQPNGVDPQALLLADGTLVVVSGRPGVYMLFDPTGTGESYRRHDVYNGMGSSYSTLIEAEPGKLFLFYDESDFLRSYKNQNPPNRIMKVEYLYR